MKTIQIQLYDFDELEEKNQERPIQSILNHLFTSYIVWVNGYPSGNIVNTFSEKIQECFYKIADTDIIYKSHYELPDAKKDIFKEYLLNNVKEDIVSMCRKLEPYLYNGEFYIKEKFAKG